MASDVKEALTEEIALEGLDGITVNALWVRLLERDSFHLEQDAGTKQYLWRCLLGLRDVEFYVMSRPRPDLVPFNRLHYIDPETKHFLETEHIPDDIYPIAIVDDKGIQGSCAEYKTRKNVTEQVHNEKPSLEQAIEKYGNKLVIVASPDVRRHALMGMHNDPGFVFNNISYAILERIGRSRMNGETTNGSMSLHVFKQNSKTMFYLLKMLRPLNVLKKQRLFSVQKNSKGKLSCILYHLSRFYKQIGTRAQRDFMNIAFYLSTHPNQMADVNKLKSDLKLYDHLKHVVRLVGADGGRYFVHIDVPYRDVHPNAKPKEYLRKNGNGEKMIRHLKMVKPLEEVKAAVEAQENNDLSEEEDEEEKEEAVADTVPDIEYPNVLDQPQVYQVLKVIRSSGSRGLSLIEIKNVSGMTRLQARRIIKMLERLECIDSIMLDRGRQKIVMYLSKENIKENTLHQSVTVELDKLTDRSEADAAQPRAAASKKKKKNKVAKKLIPVLQEEEPSEEKVSKIRSELIAVDDYATPCIDSSRIEQIQELRLSGQVNLEIKEVEPKPVFNRQTNERMLGMKRFGSALTESHVRRANWVLEVLKAVKVLENFKLTKLLRNREKEMNLAYMMDGKSLQRIIQALIEEGKIKSFKIMFSMGVKQKELTFLCLQNVSPSDDFFQRMIDEAKLRHFSVSKEELKKLQKLKRMPMGDDKHINDSIPRSARESIKNYQQYRKKVAMEMPHMAYNRTAGYKYGLLPKMLRVRAVHQYLFHLCYMTHNHSLQSSSRPGSSRDPQELSDKLTLNDQSSASNLEWNVSELPVYCDEFSWKRYCPPIPVHTGYIKGWCLISDVLLIMPVCLFCQVVNVCYDIDGLVAILDHPERRFYPVINLPFAVSQRLLHSRKYIQCFLECCSYMAEMGLLSYGREVLKDKDETFVYLHQRATLLDTRESLDGYNKTRAPPGYTFPERKFYFENSHDLDDYWEFLQIVALGSNLLHKSMVNSDHEDTVTFEEKSLAEATCFNEPSNVKDVGVLPGDKRGAAGIDSSMFIFTNKNWIFKTFNNLRLKNYPKKSFMNKPESKGQSKIVAEDRIKGKERLNITTDAGRPVTIKKVMRCDRYWGNKGGKGVPHTSITVTSTHRRVKKMGRTKTIRHIKLAPRAKPKTAADTSSASTGSGAQFKGRLKGDKKDDEIYRMRSKQRVVWTQKEDSVLLMCRLASLIMDSKRKTAVIMYTQIRDYLHETCGEVAFDKTSTTVQRRLIFVLRNPQTEANLLLYYQEAMQDEFVLQNYVNKEFILSDSTVKGKFKVLVDYLLDKFKSHDLQKCSLPETLEELSRNYSIQCVGKLTQLKQFHEPTCRADICHDVLRNILHSSVLLQDKMGRTHEMFKLLTQYPDILLSNVIRELRLDGMFVINKKNYVKEYVSQLHSGLGLRNFKCSQRYLFCFKQRYLSPMFSECARVLQSLIEARESDHGQVTLPFNIKSGETAILFPLILRGAVKLELRMPEELAIVDMKGFYSFPWGRGKTHGFATKADKSLLQTKQKRELEKELAFKQFADLNGDSGASLVKDDDDNSRLKQPEAGFDNKNLKQIGEKSTQDLEKEVSEKGMEVDTDEVCNSSAVGDWLEAASDVVIVESSEGGNELTVMRSADNKEASASKARGDEAEEIVLQWENGTLTNITEDEQEKPEESEESLQADFDPMESSSSKKLTLKEKEKVCSAEAGHVKVTEKKSTTLSKKSSAFEKIPPAEAVEEVDESYSVNAKEFTHLKTARSEIILPKQELDFTNADPMCSSSVASRTFVCLRRVEDCSFEDIRVFNAQDNFVLKSCQIKLNLLDSETDKNVNPGYSVEIFDENVETGEIIWKNLENDENPVADVDGRNNESCIQDTGSNNLRNEAGREQLSKIVGKPDEMSEISAKTGNKNDVTSKAETSKEETISNTVSGLKDFVLEKSRMKQIWANLHQLVPFQIDTDQFWAELKSSGATDQYLDLCRQVYDIINDTGELGIRELDLKKQCQWGADVRSVLDRLLKYSVILRVGVLGPRYVSLHHARPWVIHAYRNLKGRGLHIDEGKDDAPIDSEDVSATSDDRSHPDTRPTSFEEDRITLPTGSNVRLIPFTKTLVEKMQPPKKVPITLVMAAPSNPVASSSKVDETPSSKVNTGEASSAHNATKVSKLTHLEHPKSTEETGNVLVDDELQSAVNSAPKDVDKEADSSLTQESVSPAKKRRKCAETDSDSAVGSGATIESDQTKTGVNCESENFERGAEVISDTTFTSVNSKSANVEKNIEASQSNARKKKITESENGGDVTMCKVAKMDNSSTDCSEKRCASSQTDFACSDAEDIDDVTIGKEMEEGGERRMLRKRKQTSPVLGTVPATPPAKSTYDRVRLVIQPWRKPEGGVNRPVLKMMLESLMLFVMTRPACPFSVIVERYNPYMQPMVLRNLLDILEDLGCIERQFLRKLPVSLFSGIQTIDIVKEEGEDTSMVILPVDDCVMKLGQFCLEMYPNAKWPESSYAKIDANMDAE